MSAGGVIFIIFIFAAFGAVVYKDWYDSTNHSSYKDITTLKEDAKPVDIHQEKVGTRGHKRWRTTVFFDDGFRYISHKTNVANHILYYTISLSSSDTKDIIQDAIIAHSKAIKKKKRRELGQSAVVQGAGGRITEGAVVCPKCKTQCAPGSKFCHICGEKTSNECPGCGATLAPGSVFCNKCGQKI